MASSQDCDARLDVGGATRGGRPGPRRAAEDGFSNKEATFAPSAFATWTIVTIVRFSLPDSRRWTYFSVTPS